MVRKSLRERNQVTIGAVGLVVGAFLLMVSLNVSAVRSLFGEATYEARFSDTGGLRSGDPVRVDGLTVGTVSSTTIDGDGDSVKVGFRASGSTLGDETRAAVRSDNALGSKYLEISPAGDGDSKIIPLERTDPGYAVSEVLGALTANNAEIDVDKVSESLTSMSEVLSATPEEFASALSGVSALSQTIASRDAELDNLLTGANSLSAVLADRNEQILGLMRRGNSLFDEIVKQRDDISRVFADVARAADQVRAFAAENQQTMRPQLEQIDHLAKVLDDYRGNLETVLSTFPKAVRALNESVGSGPQYNAYVANLLAPEQLVRVDNILQDALGQNFTE